MQQTAVATKATTNSIRSDLHTNRIRRWLSPPDPSTNANRARTLRHEGTGAWLLENPVFKSWHLGSRQHVWLHGLAGCGKTVLSVTVLDHLTHENDSFILRFFFDFTEFLENKLTFQRWARLYQPDMEWKYDPGPPQGSRLYYACFVGLIATAQNLISNGANVNAQGGRYI